MKQGKEQTQATAAAPAAVPFKERFFSEELRIGPGGACRCLMCPVVCAGFKVRAWALGTELGPGLGLGMVVGAMRYGVFAWVWVDAEKRCFGSRRYGTGAVSVRHACNAART